jgi:xanthine dehydrogenase molybdopterin-binding subunit B
MYQEVAPGQLEDDPVGRNIKHMSGMKQTTGEAIYIDDMPKLHSKLIEITYDDDNISCNFQSTFVYMHNVLDIE